MTVTTDTLRLFGSFQLICQGKLVALGQPRLEELIALLATNSGEAIPRAQIAYQIWADSSESQARVNLRNLLHKLKQAWPDMGAIVDVTRSHLAWRDEAAIMVDIQRFERLRVCADQHPDEEERITILNEAVALYVGDFLPSCYAEWALTDRERLRYEYAMVLESLVDLLFDHRRYEAALEQAKRLQRFDPLRESAYRQLMQIYAALGDRAAALRTYHTCATTLQQELGVEPSPATEALRAQLLRLEEETAAPDVPQTAKRQRLVGRRPEWQQLQATWRRVQSGEAHCFLLRGEAGIGKTRLAEELIDFVQHQGVAWASSRSYAVEGALTYAPVAEWLRSPTIRPSLDQIDDLWRVELARLLPDLLSDHPDLPTPGPMTESWQQQRFFQSIVHALQAAPSPLLLHLDDMQWSDAETLTLLQYMLHGARHFPLLLIGGIRSEDADGNQVLAAFVEATNHARQLSEAHLGPLSADEAIELTTQTTGEEVATATAEALYTVSEGHPLYLIEAVRSGFAESRPVSERVEASPTDLYGVTAMPSPIYRLLAARLDQLSPSARQVASMASVIGRAFDYEILQRAISLDEMVLIDALDELWRRRFIREQSGDSYDFSHDRIREVTYQEISRARRQFFHRQVAVALESIHGDELDAVSGELAAHYAKAGDRSAAYRYYRLAADIALAQHALHQAEEMLDAALIYVPDDPGQRIELLQCQDHVFERSLQFERWEQNLNEETALLNAMTSPSPYLTLNYELSRSRYWVDRNEGERAIGIAQRAISMAEAMGEADLLVSSYQVLSNAFWRQARIRKSAAASGQMAIFAAQTGNRTLEGRALASQAAAGMFSGMPLEELFGLLSRAFVIAKQQNDKDAMADLYAKFSYARTRTAMGQFAQIEEDFGFALRLAKETGVRIRESVAMSTRGCFYTNSGDYRLAEETLRACQEVDRNQPLLWRNWVTLSYLGALRMQMGDLQSALAKLSKACDLLAETGSRHYEVKARNDLGLAHHLAGNQELAQAELNLALTLLSGNGDFRCEALSKTRTGYVLEANGQLAEAAKCYERGRDFHDQMGQHYYAMNALAGLARIAAMQGHNDAALDHVAIIWETIGGKEMDATIETARTLRTCYTIFHAHGDPQADAVLTMAWEQLQRRVSTIDVPVHVEQFWQIEEHGFFHEIVGF